MKSNVPVSFLLPVTLTVCTNMSAHDAALLSKFCTVFYFALRINGTEQISKDSVMGRPPKYSRRLAIHYSVLTWVSKRTAPTWPSGARPSLHYLNIGPAFSEVLTKI